MRDHLPNARTPLQSALADRWTALERFVDVPIEYLWDPWRCPAAFLPLLAYALSVDSWDDSWGEVLKRQAIADSPAYHRKKGTREAIDLGLATLGREFSFIEWFQTSPEGRRGTARLFVEASLPEIASVRSKAQRALYAAKPKSRAVWIGVGEQAAGSVVIGAGVLEEVTVTVSPYEYTGENPEGAALVGAGILEESITIVGAAA